MLYQAETKRREAVTAFPTVNDFLASLDIRARIERPGTNRVPRVAQLTQKTNQFNLTTRRYSEREIASMIDSPDHAVFTLTARDRFGDLGLSGVFIARRNGKDAAVDTLLMSCRVLGRRLEQEFVSSCIEAIDQPWRPQRWVAEYVKTNKNAQVANFWTAFGFEEQTLEEFKIAYAAINEPHLDHVPYITVEMP